MTDTKSKTIIEGPRHSTQSSRGSTGPRRRWLIALVIVAVRRQLLFFGIRSRVKAEQKSARGDCADGRAFGDSSAAEASTPAQEIVLPGNIQPFISSPIYARVDGYLKKWYFDIGAHVKAGQLLAVIPRRKLISNWHRPKAIWPRRRRIWNWRRLR